MSWAGLQGKRALVTGASQGIGEDTCRSLLEQGCTVYGLDCSSATTEHEHYVHLELNLESSGDIEACFEQYLHRLPCLDYVVNVAGIDPKCNIREAKVELWNRVVDINLRAYYLVIHHSMNLLAAGKGKSIVNVSSINYQLGLEGRSIYSTTKAGICGLTVGLARELGVEGIRINTVSPGWVFTERQKQEYFNCGDEAKRQEYLSHLKKVQSLDIQVQPRDISNTILFYLSDLSRACTGGNMVVDGGWILE